MDDLHGDMETLAEFGRLVLAEREAHHHLGGGFGLGQAEFALEAFGRLFVFVVGGRRKADFDSDHIRGFGP